MVTILWYNIPMKINDLKIILSKKYENIKPIKNGVGGNATVYSAVKIDSGEKIALKILNSNGSNKILKRKRFVIETKKVIELQSVNNGIIPIFDYGLPDEADENLYWYTMPIAQPISEYFRDKDDFIEVILCVISLASTLTELHKHDIVHRDIKPANIFYLEGRYCLGDFGLVDYPEKEDLTKTTDRVGAKATIAPEMKRNTKIANVKKADVYSLAKTLWMLLTKNKYGFEGTYNQNSSLMRLEMYYQGKHLVEVTRLLIDSTQDAPDLRPTMYDFVNRLLEYVKIYNNFEKSNLSQWEFIQENLFMKPIPESAYWKDINDIVNVLNLIGSMPSLNHMFIPSGGGLDFEYAETSGEEGCLILNASQNVFIVKPLQLYVENIEGDYKWSYFRLELDNLKETGLSEIHNDTEFVTEHLPGQYCSWICGNYGHYENSNPLPQNYRMVTRVLSGSFVFFSKASIYNRISGTYDARHNGFDANEFRNYIKKLRQDAMKMNKTDFEKHNFSISSYITNLDDKEMIKNITDAKLLKSYVKDYFTKFDFADYCTQSALDNDSNILHYSLNVCFNGKLFEPFLQFANNRVFIENNESAFPVGCKKSTLLLFFRDINEVVNFKNKCENDIENICSENNLKMQSGIYHFSINLIRNKPPIHLFTKKEIRDVLRKGNDHKNNTLIIDCNGYAKLIQGEEYFLLRQYPVIHETYNAYNNYVGQYSLLANLQNAYILSLQGWLQHLQIGGCIKMDYLREMKEDELLDEIKKYYTSISSG